MFSSMRMYRPFPVSPVISVFLLDQKSARFSAVNIIAHYAPLPLSTLLVDIQVVRSFSFQIKCHSMDLAALSFISR